MISIARCMPQMRCHELGSDRDGMFAVDLEHPFRLILSPRMSQFRSKMTGGYDWSRIRKIRVLDVIDYH